MKQRFTSKQTSINSTKAPAVYSMKRAVNVMTGKTVVDIGGGQFDTAAEAARVYGAAVSIYDPFNRTPEHNAAVLAGSYDVAVISNVLNVIDSEVARGLECCPVWSFDSSNTEKINFYLKSIDK